MKTNRILMAISLVIVLVVNILANSLPINGITTGEISDQFPILFVPAGYVFSIWGLIYLALIGFTIYTLTPKGRNNEMIDSIAGWFVAANLFNTAWVFLWHYQQFALTLIPIFGLLIRRRRSLCRGAFIQPVRWRGILWLADGGNPFWGLAVLIPVKVVIPVRIALEAGRDS